MFGWGIFCGKSLLQERESSWEITLTEPILIALEILHTDWPENNFYGESVGKSCKTTLSPSYTKWFFSSIEVHVVAWPVQQEDFRWEFQEGDIGGVLSASTTSANTEISQKIAKYRNASIGRVETGCHTTITTLYVKFTANNTETTIRNL